jgi:hypothetical protein
VPRHFYRAFQRAAAFWKLRVAAAPPKEPAALGLVEIRRKSKSLRRKP